jgi:hypothetical protein
MRPFFKAFETKIFSANFCLLSPWRITPTSWDLDLQASTRPFTKLVTSTSWIEVHSRPRNWCKQRVKKIDIVVCCDFITQQRRQPWRPQGQNGLSHGGGV